MKLTKPERKVVKKSQEMSRKTGEYKTIAGVTQKVKIPTTTAANKHGKKAAKNLISLKRDIEKRYGK